MVRVPIGERIREQRKRRGITQGEVSRRLEISPGYLSLIENNKRMIGGSLLLRMADVLGVDSDHLTAYRDDRLAADLVELVRGLDWPKPNESTAAAFVGHSPDWARAFVRVCRQLQETTDRAFSLAERLSRDPELTELAHQILTQITSIRSFAEILAQYDNVSGSDQKRFATIVAEQSDQLTRSARAMMACFDADAGSLRGGSPEREVDDFIIDHRNHFASLEESADRLRCALGRRGRDLDSALADRLERCHGVTIRKAGNGQGATEAELVLEHCVPPSTARFLVARALVERELRPSLDSVLDGEQLTTPLGREKARSALARYAAGSLLFPYDAVLEQAERTRYDLERMTSFFGASFEQIAQRLVTLRRTGAEGIPFAFLRTDAAGNISKRFSLPDLRMPHYGSACALWIVYATFATPGRTLSQLLETPDGARFLFIGRHVVKAAAAHARPAVQFSVMLGCDGRYADRIVYGDAYGSGHDSLVTRGGFECRSCSRQACGQRAFDPVIAADDAHEFGGTEAGRRGDCMNDGSRPGQAVYQRLGAVS